MRYILEVQKFNNGNNMKIGYTKPEASDYYDICVH